MARHIKSGEQVIDLCAGAGGKTLALAAMMGGRGRLILCPPGGEKTFWQRRYFVTVTVPDVELVAEPVE